MSTEESRKLATEAFEAWRDGKAPIRDFFDPAMTWRIEGFSLAAGEYTSTADFITKVLGPFSLRFPADAPFRPKTIRSIVADGDTVVVLWDGHGTATDGIAYDNSYAWFLTLRDGKVIDGKAFFDSKAFDDLWTRVTPRA